MRFYGNLVSGTVKRGWWGRDSRFDPLREVNPRNIEQHFLANVYPYINKEDRVLDFGCGSGVFLVRLAKVCQSIVGVDISKPLVDIATGAIQDLRLDNARALNVKPGALGFDSGSFDRVLMVDVIHHLEDVDAVLGEAHRVLKPGGKLVIFEPNKLNPALLIMCILDRNEWGLLPLGTKRAYEEVLSSRFKIEHFSFCGLLIGPDSWWAFAVANFLLRPPFARVLKFFSPKVFIVAAAL